MDLEARQKHSPDTAYLHISIRPGRMPRDEFNRVFVFDTLNGGPRSDLLQSTRRLCEHRLGRRSRRVADRGKAGPLTIVNRR